MKNALITGVSGQAGSYLSEQLLEKGYQVFGLLRRTSTDNMGRIKPLLDNSRFHIIYGDITDSGSLHSAVTTVQPHEVYHLAAQSHVWVSFKEPVHTFQATAVSTVNLLEALRQEKPDARLYNAASSEMFGSCIGTNSYQDEQTTMIPNSPYATAKLAAYHMCRLYRESYGMFICNGINFNFESPRRGENFVTRKITQYVAKLYNTLWSSLLSTTFQGTDAIVGVESLLTDDFVRNYPKLKLGNIQAYRDWGYAGDTMNAAHLMLQADEPDDYVIATGETHTVREFLEKAFGYIGVRDWSSFVTIDEALLRAKEVPYLCGNSGRAQFKLGWKPSTTFNDLVRLMVQADIDLLRKERIH